jgi:hypothetical protein
MHSQAFRYVVFMVVVVVLGGLSVAASQRSATSIHDGDAPTPRTVSPPMSPTISAQ